MGPLIRSATSRGCPDLQRVLELAGRSTETAISLSSRWSQSSHPATPYHRFFSTLMGIAIDGEPPLRSG
jgi:hypothetical protein